MVNDGSRGWKKAKLSTQQKNEIRQRYGDGETSWDLAVEFGVTAAAIRYYGGTRSPGHPGGHGYTGRAWTEKHLARTATDPDTVCHDEAPSP